MLRIAAAVVVLAVLLQVRTDQRVEFGFAPGYPMPETCGSRILWGIECPGCGLTRSFVWLCHGNWSAGWRAHRIGWLMLAAVLGQAPYRLLALAELHSGTIREPVWPKVFGWSLIAALIGNWLLRQFGI